MHAIRTGFLIVVCAVAPLAAGDGGDGGGTPMGAPPDPVLERYNAARAAKDWTRAQGVLREAVQTSPRNAEYHNLYAYSLHQTGRPDMALVFKHYNEALRLDPRHRGAREYLGEAYLKVGDLAGAKQQLRELDRLCFFSCSEFRDLKEKIEAFEKGKK